MFCSAADVDKHVGEIVFVLVRGAAFSAGRSPPKSTTSVVHTGKHVFFKTLLL